MTRVITPSTSWSSRRAATLSSLVAEQRLVEVARAAERRRAVGLGQPVEPVEGRWTSRMSMVRTRMTRVLDMHASRAEGRARTAPAATNSQLVCCA